MSSYKATIKDIALEAGVSISLVSFVMNNREKADGKGKVYRVSDETTRKIMEVARKLDYQPNNAARSLRSGRTNSIGVIVSDISNKFFADIAREIEDTASHFDYTVFFGSSDENAEKLEKITNVLINRGIDGLIIVPCEKSETTINKIMTAGIPLVLLDRSVEGIVADCVLLNNRKAAHIATESLIAKGKTKIEMISYAMHLSNIQDREAGYKMAMSEHGLGANIHIHNIKFKNIPIQINKVVEDILARNVEGVVFATNTLTIEGVKCIYQKNPTHFDHLSVVGFDESDAFDLFSYKIPYIKQPINLFGSESVRILLDNITNRKQQIVATTLNPLFIDPE